MNHSHTRTGLVFSEYPLPHLGKHARFLDTTKLSFKKRFHPFLWNALQQLHQTPQPITSSTHPQTPRFAPAVTSVYEKDRHRTGTMFGPNTSVPPGVPAVHQVHQEGADGRSDTSSEDLEDLDQRNGTTRMGEKEGEKGGNEVLRRGLN